VDNAVKYSHEGGSVTIRCGRRGSEPFLEVEDDGPGVRAAERPRILERFYRVQGTQGEGNGLGLAIAEEIARVHRSHLQLAAGCEGRGLKVTLGFPG
jgi:two-component system, OmpR family, sensor histidine kinase TctE